MNMIGQHYPAQHIMLEKTRNVAVALTLLALSGCSPEADDASRINAESCVYRETIGSIVLSAPEFEAAQNGGPLADKIHDLDDRGRRSISGFSYELSTEPTYDISKDNKKWRTIVQRVEQRMIDKIPLKVQNPLKASSLAITTGNARSAPSMGSLSIASYQEKTDCIM